MADDQPAEGATDETTPPVDPESTDAENAPQDPQDAPQATDSQTSAQQGLEQGYAGAIAEVDADDPNRIQTVEQAGPEDNTEHPDGYHGTVPADDLAKKDDGRAVPLQDLPGYPRNLTQTTESRVGYLGEVPTSNAEREAMSVQGQAAVAREQYGDGRPDTQNDNDTTTEV